MSEINSKQTLITKQDDQAWAKILHGEMMADDDNDTHAEALLVRNYLIARDEIIALQEMVPVDELNELSEDEARVIYQQASQEIHNRATSRLDQFKGFVMPATIGALSLAVMLLILPENIKYSLLGGDDSTMNIIAEDTSTYSDLDFSGYTSLGVGIIPGEYPNMLLVAGGRFMMGCTSGWDDVAGCRPNEYPAHEVTVAPFEIAQHEVTVGQFKKFVDETGFLTDAEKESRGCVHRDMPASGAQFVMSSEITWHNPGFPQDAHSPVTCVSWADSQAYIEWISSKQEKKYRLPTEAEWEFAARGGKANAYHWGSEARATFANYIGGDDGSNFTTLVGHYPANHYGIQDMSGNVWEWVSDCWHDTYQGAPMTSEAWLNHCSGSDKYTRRGGAWDAPAQGIRSAIRSAGGKNDRSVYYGFRIAHDYKK